MGMGERSVKGSHCGDGIDRCQGFSFWGWDREVSRVLIVGMG